MARLLSSTLEEDGTFTLLVEDDDGNRSLLTGCKVGQPQWPLEEPDGVVCMTSTVSLSPGKTGA